MIDWFKVKEQDGKRDIANDRDRARYFQPLFAGRQLASITSTDCDEALDEGQAHNDWSNGTRNRYRSLLTALFNYAVEKGWLTTAPRIRRAKEAKIRVRWLSKDEAARLYTELPLHLERMVRFSLLTGMRQSNVAGLRWENVDLERRQARIWADEAKGDEQINVPLSDEAYRLLLEAKACREHGHPAWVFTFEGKPILQPTNTAWYAALERADIKGFRWHDLRKTFVVWHLQAGTPLAVVQKLGGWKSLAVMMKHYAGFEQDYTAKFAGNVSAT